MESRGRVMYVSYEEAQKLIPIFKELSKYPNKEIRDLSRSIKQELELVRDISYEPLGGKQVFLSRKERELWDSVTGVMEKG